MRDADGRVVYSRGYGPIFAEWITTAEAATAYRTFHESFRFPEPAAPVDVVVFRRDAAQAFVEVWRTRVDPKGLFVNRAAPPPQALIEVERHGDPERAVDLLLLGDGYTAAQCDTKFRADAARMANALFAREPFRERRRDFNVWGLCAPAAEAGVARPSADVWRRTPVGATYDIFGSERYVLTYQNRAFRDVAAWAPYEFVTILVNSATYGGGGLYNVYSTAAVDSAWAEYLFVHEFAHHFAALADEYYTSPVAYATPATVVEPWEPNVTALLPGTRLKWADLVTPGTPLPTPWPKEAFEAYQRPAQAQRAKLRADRRPEAEMDALFTRGARLHDADLRAPVREGRRLPGRLLRRRGLLSARSRLRDVHPQPGALLRGVPARPDRGHRPPRPAAIQPLAADRHHVELLVVQLHVGLDDDVLAERLLEVAEHAALLVLQARGRCRG